ncbi:MAG: hypothetical protein EOO38_22025 [Cytophagaceae bacterium]|nr:MAG: hypothetical protein EOO38_22025 [Cytophagaceae bacterium]
MFVLPPFNMPYPQPQPAVGWLFVAVSAYPLIDQMFATSLSLEVEVKGHRLIPAHVASVFRNPSYKPDIWQLRVSDSKREGWVQVTQRFYESAQVGDRIYVKGRRGLISRNLYLESASKKRKK